MSLLCGSSLFAWLYTRAAVENTTFLVLVATMVSLLCPIITHIHWARMAGLLAFEVCAGLCSNCLDHLKNRSAFSIAILLLFRSVDFRNAMTSHRYLPEEVRGSIPVLFRVPASLLFAVLIMQVYLCFASFAHR